MYGNDSYLGSNLGTKNSFLSSTICHLHNLVSIISPLNPSTIFQAGPTLLNQLYSSSHTDWVEAAHGFWAPVLYSFHISILHSEIICREGLTGPTLHFTMRNQQQKSSLWEFCILPAVCNSLLVWRKHMAELWVQQGKCLWCEHHWLSDAYS